MLDNAEVRRLDNKQVIWLRKMTGHRWFKTALNKKRV